MHSSQREEEMLKSRVLTALVLLALFLSALFALPVASAFFTVSKTASTVPQYTTTGFGIRSGGAPGIARLRDGLLSSLSSTQRTSQPLEISEISQLGGGSTVGPYRSIRSSHLRVYLLSRR